MSLSASLPSMRHPWPDLVVVGGANMDFVMQVEDFPQPQQGAVADQFQHLPGGKGLNQAVAAARLGARVALVAMLGYDHHADEIRERLQAEGIDTRFVFQSSNAATGATSIWVDSHGRSLRTAFPGANRLLLQQEVEAAKALLVHAGMVLAQLEVPLPAVRHAFQLARQAGVRTMLDAGPPTELDDGLLGLVSILRADAEEAKVAGSSAVSASSSAIDAARSLLLGGPEAVAVGTGDGGNAIVTADAYFTYAAEGGTTVDKTGAGDAFTAAFATALLEGRDLQEAGAFAHANSGHAVGILGALPSLPARRELEGHLLRPSGMERGSMAPRQNQ